MSLSVDANVPKQYCPIERPTARPASNQVAWNCEAKETSAPAKTSPKKSPAAKDETSIISVTDRNQITYSMIYSGNIEETDGILVRKEGEKIDIRGQKEFTAVEDYYVNGCFYSKTKSFYAATQAEPRPTSPSSSDYHLSYMGEISEIEQEAINNAETLYLLLPGGREKRTAKKALRRLRYLAEGFGYYGWSGIPKSLEPLVLRDRCYRQPPTKHYPPYPLQKGVKPTTVNPLFPIEDRDSATHSFVLSFDTKGNQERAKIEVTIGVIGEGSGPWPIDYTAYVKSDGTITIEDRSNNFLERETKRETRGRGEEGWIEFKSIILKMIVGSKQIRPLSMTIVDRKSVADFIMKALG